MTGYVMYFDESYDEKNPYIVLGGVIVSFNKWYEINNKMKDLKKNYFNDENYNLKNVRRYKHLKKDGTKDKWSSLTKDKKEQYNKDYFEIIGKDICLIVSLIEKSQMNLKERPELFKLAYSFLIERYEYFLDDIGDVQGIVIADKAEGVGDMKNIVSLHEDILKNGLTVSKTKPKGRSALYDEKKRESVRPIKNIIEKLFQESDDSNNFIQIADLVAAAFASEYNKKNKKYSSQYMSLLRKATNGEVDGYGIKLFPHTFKLNYP